MNTKKPSVRNSDSSPDWTFWMPERLHDVVALDPGDDGVPDEFDFGLRAGAVLQVGTGAQLVAPVDDRDLGSEARKEQAFLQGAIAAANHGHGLISEECPVAGGADGDAAAPQLLLTGYPQEARAGTGGDDDRARLVGGGAAGEGEGRAVEVDFGDLVVDDLGPEAFGLALHAHGEVGSGDFLEAGVVFDVVGGGDLAAQGVAGEDQRGEIGAGGVDGGGQPGRPRTQNRDIVHRALPYLTLEECLSPARVASSHDD